jgi:hypothetical protein
VSKLQAVRDALAELGTDATVEAVLAFVRDRFGLELKAKTVRTYRSVVAGKRREPPEQPTPPTQPVEGLNKIGAVRRILKEIGTATTPQELADAVLERFGIEISPKAASSYRAIIMRGGKRKAPKKVKVKPPAPVATAAVSKSPPASITLDDIQAVKQLADRLGVKKMLRLVGILYPKAG